MYTLRVDQNKHVNKLYQYQVINAFPALRLKFNSSEINLALMESGKIIGGITLEFFDDLSKDETISEHFVIHKKEKVIKMKRLWVNHSNSKLGLLKIFDAVLENVPRESFLYGVLSFPLDFALKSQQFMPENKKWLSPKMSLNECQWDKSMSNSSEGKRLLKTYLMFGAHALGEMSGCLEDHSVRLVMGMNLKDFNYQTLASRYA